MTGERKYDWSENDIASLTKMLDAGGVTQEAMADRLGRSVKAVRTRITLLTRGAGRTTMKPCHRWTDQDIAQLRRMHAEGLTFAQIGAAMGRTQQNCKSKFHNLELDIRKAAAAGNASSAPDSPRIDPEAIIRRDARLALSHRSITAAFFGDPLPGESALDRRVSP